MDFPWKAGGAFGRLCRYQEDKLCKALSVPSLGQTTTHRDCKRKQVGGHEEESRAGRDSDTMTQPEHVAHDQGLGLEQLGAQGS